MNIEDLLKPAPISEPSTLLPEIDRIPTWLNCHTGHGNAFAILLAALNPRIKLLRISTINGNVSLEYVTYNNHALTKEIERDDVARYDGASRPLPQDLAHASDIHRDSRLDRMICLQGPTVPARCGDAMWAIKQLLRKEPAGGRWLVATGPPTDEPLHVITPDDRPPG